jgi:hypothetical protein
MAETHVGAGCSSKLAGAVGGIVQLDGEVGGRARKKCFARAEGGTP